MKRINRFIYNVVGLLATSTITHAAISNNVSNDATSITDTRISLSQAVIAAEQYVKGKATHAKFETHKQTSGVYEVEVINGRKAFDVKVDATNSTVISSKEDKIDEEDEND